MPAVHLVEIRRMQLNARTHRTEPRTAFGAKIELYARRTGPLSVERTDAMKEHSTLAQYFATAIIRIQFTPGR